MLITDNVRLVDSDGNVDSSWKVRPGDDLAVKRSHALLADYRKEEPAAGWHLETRGEIASWHDWLEVPAPDYDPHIDHPERYTDGRPI